LNPYTITTLAYAVYCAVVWKLICLLVSGNLKTSMHKNVMQLTQREW